MKFAYLIMAHHNPEQLKKLLRLLDYEENAIYLHIDKKSPMAKSLKEFQITEHAKLHIYTRYKVAWGSFAQTKCQLFLMENAVTEQFDYYHLLSGSDLPIKTQREIQEFFKEYKGMEFIHFEQREPIKAGYMPFYNKSCFTRGNRRKRMFKKLDNILLRWQEKRGIKRKLYKGANWFSITHEFAALLVKKKKKVLGKVRNWHNSDEYVLQTFFMEQYAPERKYGGYENDYRDCLRYIDWKRGNPYVWRLENYEELMASPYLFARKFDEQTDSEIIEKIYSRLQNG